MGLTTPSVHASSSAMASSSTSNIQKCHQPHLPSSTEPVFYLPHPNIHALIDVDSKSIQFIRSDAQEHYIPSAARTANRDLAGDGHVYTDLTTDNSSTQKWRKKIGAKLAKHYSLPGEETGWTIASFPANYCFVKIEAKIHKGNNDIRWKLYGGSVKRYFQACTEFEEHAIWLTRKDCEQNLCYCKRCHDLSKKVTSTSIPATQSWSRLIQRQLAPQTDYLPGVPIASISVCRAKELGRLEQTPTSNNHEGFRKHEVALVTLSMPIRYDDGKQSKVIDAWPVLVTAVEHKAVSRDQSVASNGNGQVESSVKYSVAMLGSDEAFQVDSSRLRPAIGNPLLTFSVQKIVAMTDVRSRMNEVQTKTLNLENGKPRANIRDILCALLRQLLLLSHITKEVVATDPFNNQSDWDGIDKTKAQNITLPAFVEQERSRRKSVNFAISEKDKNSIPLQSISVESVNYATLADEDDSSSRRRREDQKKAIATSIESKMIEKEDTNRYWTGLFIGFERLWVGDVVRLNLYESDIRHLIDLLAERNDLSNRIDKSVPNLQSPVVMRIKAIFQKAEDANLCIAGDLYRIVNIEDAKRSFQDFNEWSVAHPEQAHMLVDNRFPSDCTLGRRYDSNSRSTLSYGSKDFAKSAPTYLPPCYSQLPGRKDGQLPPSPKLPDGFGYQKVNQPSVEVVVGAPHIAGRLYCSMITSKNEVDPVANLAGRVRELQLLAHSANDQSVDGNQIRICLAGLLSGTKLSMGIQSVEPFHGTRLEFLRNAAATANAQIKTHLLNAQQEQKLTDGKGVKLSTAEPTNELGKRKFSDGKPTENGESVKRRKGEEVEMCENVEHKNDLKTQTDHSTAFTSQSDIKMKPLGELKSEDNQLKEERKTEKELVIYDAPPPGFLTRIHKDLHRFYYINPVTRESKWGKKVKREELEHILQS